MNQILTLIGLIIVALIVFRLMAAIASFVFRIWIVLALVIIGYVWWTYVRH